MEHIGIDTADGKALVINPAPGVLKKITGPGIIVLCFEGIPGYIERPVLVAELGEGSRFNRLRIDLPGPHGIPVKKKYMAIERPCTAPAAAVASESDIPDNLFKTFLRVCQKIG
jgi:hypothetical protein